MLVNLPRRSDNEVGLFDFQNECVDYLLENTLYKSDNTIVVKAPTGAGKTIILIEYIDRYLHKTKEKIAFLWLCPGDGDLEEQSKNKMMKYMPTSNCKSLIESIRNGFECNSITFVNWELVNKSSNKVIQEREKSNLFDRIKEAHRSGINFILIIDEAHSNDTDKANSIIDLFSSKNIIRVSATIYNNNPKYDFHEIDEERVIESGLITKAIVVNEGLKANLDVNYDYDYLLDLAAEKRDAIQKEYEKIGESIRPMVLIQFPSGDEEMIRNVEKKLISIGNYRYDNNMVYKWLSNDKVGNKESLTENDGEVIFLLMKQAIALGWDCPRAKILVKLREGGEETFQIQTIGRIRRMPKAIHYNNELLDCSYVYTMDNKFRQEMIGSLTKAYSLKTVELKDKCRSFRLPKEMKDNRLKGISESRELLNKLYYYLKNRYSFTSNLSDNNIKMREIFNLNKEINQKVIQGTFIRNESLLDSRIRKDKYINTVMSINKTAILFLWNTYREIASSVGITNDRILDNILRRLFSKNEKLKKYKIINLQENEYIAFIINNKEKLKEIFRDVSSEIHEQIFIHASDPVMFSIPLIESYRFDYISDNGIEIKNNAYNGYTKGFLAKDTKKSKSERLFEEYCMKNKEIDWYYKNGDSGDKYFSIIYFTGIGKQSLFYPDYIIKMKNGIVWIIETKGGEEDGVDQNIDRQVYNKFIALRRYINQYQEEYNLKWGFVREKNSSELYINNTKYTKNLSDSNWKKIEDIF